MIQRESGELHENIWRLATILMSVIVQYIKFVLYQLLSQSYSALLPVSLSILTRVYWACYGLK